MAMASDSIYTPKRDLHIGGLGAKSTADPSIWADEILYDASTIAQRAREAVGRADEFVRARPWHAIGIAALLSLAAGLLIARRI